MSYKCYWWWHLADTWNNFESYNEIFFKYTTDIGDLLIVASLSWFFRKRHSFLTASWERFNYSLICVLATQWLHTFLCSMSLTSHRLLFMKTRCYLIEFRAVQMFELWYSWVVHPLITSSNVLNAFDSSLMVAGRSSKTLIPHKVLFSLLFTLHLCLRSVQTVSIRLKKNDQCRSPSSKRVR